MKTEQPGRSFAVSRVFDAPRELVWKAHTESPRLKQWWGPKGFKMIAADLDLRPGGVFHYGMRAPEGFEMWGRFAYREIVRPERLVFVVSFSDEKGGIVRHPYSAAWPLEVLNTMTLSELGDRTTVALSGTPINATEEERRTFESAFAAMEQGFKGTLDQLASYLARAA